MSTCPTCGHTSVGNPRRTRQLAGIGDAWTEIAVGSSRWHVHALRKAHPDYQFRAERMTLMGGSAGAWRIEARRRP